MAAIQTLSPELPVLPRPKVLAKRGSVIAGARLTRPPLDREHNRHLAGSIFIG